MIETEFKGTPQREIPNEIAHAQAICQHASALLSDIVRGGFEGNHAEMVALAFNTADSFDAELQKRMKAAVDSLPKPSPLVLT